MKIVKEIKVVLTQKEIDSPQDIQIVLNVMSEEDLKNNESVRYVITYPKKQNSNDTSKNK